MVPGLLHKAKHRERHRESHLSREERWLSCRYFQPLHAKNLQQPCFDAWKLFLAGGPFFEQGFDFFEGFFFGQGLEGI